MVSPWPHQLNENRFATLCPIAADYIGVQEHTKGLPVQTGIPSSTGTSPRQVLAGKQHLLGFRTLTFWTYVQKRKSYQYCTNASILFYYTQGLLLEKCIFWWSNIVPTRSKPESILSTWGPTGVRDKKLDKTFHEYTSKGPLRLSTQMCIGWRLPLLGQCLFDKPCMFNDPNYLCWLQKYFSFIPLTRDYLLLHYDWVLNKISKSKC